MCRDTKIAVIMKQYRIGDKEELFSVKEYQSYWINKEVFFGSGKWPLTTDEFLDKFIEDYNAGRLTDKLNSRLKRKFFYDSQDWKDLSSTLKSLLGNECAKCGEFDPFIHSDHVIPRSIAPSKELDLMNLQPLCGNCDTEKGNKSCKDYRSKEQIEILKKYLECN